MMMSIQTVLLRVTEIAGIVRKEKLGQGTTEYAILVGVLVVTNTIHWR